MKTQIYINTKITPHNKNRLLYLADSVSKSFSTRKDLYLVCFDNVLYLY